MAACGGEAAIANDVTKTSGRRCRKRDTAREISILRKVIGYAINLPSYACITSEAFPRISCLVSVGK